MSKRPKRLVSDNDSGYNCGHIDEFRSFAKGLLICAAILIFLFAVIAAIFMATSSDGIGWGAACVTVFVGPFSCYFCWLIVRVVCDFLYDAKAMRMKICGGENAPSADEYDNGDDGNEPIWTDRVAESEKKEKEDNELRAALKEQKDELDMYKRMVQELLAQQNKND